ncbi:type I restriction enzyme HsdR N-terminal domain-containing protein [Flavobacterium sp. GCM10023249]|uniref:type I restriction enzyme HsdR N-terminal domain-containing protein n=1 Tax=unclassified Flavobacterium TaxID=196869 RepID=UPI00361E4612
MPINKQIANVIKKSLSKFDFNKLEEKCTNEAQTRQYLIEPIIEILGYSRMDDMLTEINAGWGQKNDRADIGLLIKGKNPEIIVECKKYGKTLTDKEASQLNGYFINTPSSKLGILTNGIEWRIYSADEANKETILNVNPFLVLDFNEINDALIDTLSKLHKNNIDVKELLEEATDFYFMRGFSVAFANELYDPSDDFLKAIFNRMNGKRLTDPLKSKIREQINSSSIQKALYKVIEEESKNGSLIITTAEELKIYHAIKTILIHKKEIDADRISYRDQKNSFNILVDDNNKKNICKILNSRNNYSLEINGNKYDVKGIESVVALKKQLLDAAMVHFQK